MPSPYVIRKATLADIPALVGHRRSMFADMGIHIDAAVLNAFDRWVRQALPASVYHAWVVDARRPEIPAGPASAMTVVAGAGMTVIPWPPGPRDSTPHAAFVYNVYTEPAHRRRGLARALMTTMQEWCRGEGIRSILLHASPDGRALYESLGYRSTNEMRLTMED